MWSGSNHTNSKMNSPQRGSATDWRLPSLASISQREIESDSNTNTTEHVAPGAACSSKWPHWPLMHDTDWHCWLHPSTQTWWEIKPEAASRRHEAVKSTILHRNATKCTLFRESQGIMRTSKLFHSKWTLQPNMCCVIKAIFVCEIWRFQWFLF